jgi:hypothetical protein
LLEVRVLLLSTVCIVLGLLFGCDGKPSATRNYPSSSPGLSVVVEDFEEPGPITADTTRVYGVFTSNGKTVRRLIVEGEYLGLSRVDWKGVGELQLCISPRSMTSSFYNNIVFSAESTSIVIHTTLVQSCSK